MFSWEQVFLLLLKIKFRQSEFLVVLLLDDIFHQSISSKKKSELAYYQLSEVWAYFPQLYLNPRGINQMC